jgi:seryl-tRNA synthetase
MTGNEFPASPPDLLDQVGAAIFHSLGVVGVYARTRLYEEVIDRLEAYISAQRDPKAEVLHFPPVMSRAQLEKSGYLASFPNLLGCVCALHGSETEIRTAAQAHDTGGDWTQSLSALDLVLSPAACYPAYPLAAARGRLPVEGLLFDVEATCFRHEPSKALSRLQSFRMREFVCIGKPAQIAAFREDWLSRAIDFAARLGLPGTLDVANDPFFGRVGQILAVAQRQNALKFELLIPYHPGATPTACMSFNSHKDHFGKVWDIATDGGDIAHTSCVAFGMDRLAVALFCVHGVTVAKWPASVRRTLAL